VTDGDLDAHAECNAKLQQASEEIAGLVATVRSQASTIGRLKADPEKKLREHADWERAHRLFRVWARATGHTKSKFGVPRFKKIKPYLSEYEDEILVRAISGLAAHPFIDDSGEVHNWWQTLFNPEKPDNIERYANKAPKDWRATTLEEYAAEEAAAARKRF